MKTDYVHLGDCVEYLRQIKAEHPGGVFDLAFADPPYNLKKLYDQYDDTLAEQAYLDWCNAWLAGMADTLKPGGSLFVLNLPKWAINHAVFLNDRLDFQHWIVWDALSDPRGKLMPAHYALLYYTKPGAPPVFNPLTSDPPDYCRRPPCMNSRPPRPTELTDIWFDVHRIKHKRDRDAHPCQLPEKLMERIIRLTTNPGDLIFDPFCGAGTTALAAQKLGRRFVVTDVDANYVRITTAKLATPDVPRVSVPKPKRTVSKREVELYLQNLARELGRIPTEAEVTPAMLAKIDARYPNRGAAFKRAKIALRSGSPGYNS
ncbi:MAG: site-specific DNA-methyltransferase [Verrucomicrobiota bacterium]